MSLYRKNLWRLGISLMVMTAIDLGLNVFSAILVFQYTGKATFFLQPYAVIAYIKDGLYLLAGVLSCLLHKRTNHRAWIIWVELGLLIACILDVVFTINGNIDRLIDAPLVTMVMILYTIVQMGRGDRLWRRIRSAKPVELDLKLNGGDQWFDPIVIGPRLELSDCVSNAVDRFLANAHKPQPLRISIQGTGGLSEAKQEIMREIYAAHYEDEERSVNRYLEARYGRALVLIISSLCAIWVFCRVPNQSGETATWTILSNFAGFSLWQIGTTYFERSEGFQRLLRMSIAKRATIEFLG